MDQSVTAVLAEKERGDEVQVVEPSATVAQAVRQMNDHHIGSLLVMEDDRLVGIFTERDVLTRIVDPGRDPRSTRVKEVMTADLVTIRKETTVRDAMRIITQRRCRHLPVVERGVGVGAGRLLGMVSIGDLTRWMVRDQQNHIEDLERYIRTG